MTTEASQPRRSTRIRDLAVSQPVQEDGEAIEVDYEDDSDASDFEDSPKKRKRAQNKAAQANKKAKNSSSGKDTEKSAKSDFSQLRDEFEDHHLFQALNDPEVSIAELATDWVDEYRKNKNDAKKGIVNLTLNCVGCLTKIEAHDVANNESAAETVGEIQTFFKRQKIHEFFLMSKKPEHKHLKKSFIQFITQIVSVSDEKGLLYENVLDDGEEDEEEDDSADTNVIEDLLIWFSSFSVSSVRSLRYVSTLALLTMETALCRATQQNSVSLEKFKKQLASEQSKKQTAALKKRVAQIQSNVDDFISQSTILGNFVEDIINTTFIHRFKDVDHYIRVESMNSLGEWMEVLPESFYSVKYLKYLGWVLSDSNASVRLQVLKTLMRLLKHNTVVAGVRQFFERFKDRIVEMALSDVDIWVKTNAISLLTETNKLGFLDDTEVSKLGSLIFDTEEKKTVPLVANFIRSVQEDKTAEALEANQSAIEAVQREFPLDLRDLIKLSIMIKTLEEAHALRGSTDSELTPPHLEPSDYAIAAKVFTEIKGFDYETLATAIEYFLLDTSIVVTIEDEDLVDLIQLTSSERSVLLGYIHGLMLGLSEIVDKRSDMLPKIISQMSALLKKSELSTEDLSIFIQVLVLIPLHSFEEQNEAASYKALIQSLIKYFKNNNVIPLEQEFELLMDTLKEYQDTTSISEIHSLFTDLLAELRIELSNSLKSKDFEFTDDTMEQLYEDYIFKIGILGSNYETTSILPLFEDVKHQLLLILDTQQLDGKSVDLAITGVFKLWLSAFVWKFESLLTSNELYDLEKEFKAIVDYLYEGKDILVNEKIPLSIRTHVASYLMACYTGLKSFFEFYEESEKTNLSNAARLKEMEFNSFKLDDGLVEGLKDIFLRNEAVLASTMDVMLERDDNEDIAYSSIKADFDPEDEEGKEAVQWKAETELVEITERLLMFAKFEMIDQKFIERMSLNAELLGELFNGAIEDGLEEDEEEEHEHEHSHPSTPKRAPQAAPEASTPVESNTRLVQGHEFQDGEEFVDGLPMEDAE